ncbi:hypothetical protein TorRG33x02_315830, partial [Trema orientale]|uniref:Uncharacterized protein n=2 Tax=Cannabaceae TaxID=3481 RepID=A0A2P5BM59_PARAD
MDRADTSGFVSGGDSLLEFLLLVHLVLVC